MTKFSKYTAQQLADDPQFIDWVTDPTKEKSDFWKTIQQDNPLLKKEIALARIIINSYLPNEKKIAPENINFIWHRIQTKRRYRYKKYINRAAAILVFAILASGGLLYKNLQKKAAFLETEENINAFSQLYSNDEQPILFNEEQVDLDFSNEHGVLMNNDSTLRLTQSNQGEEITIEKIVVPYGKRFFLTLNDKSRVCINSGSQLVFPRKFTKSKREVYLVGEAYFDVSHNKEIPFVVHTKNSSVKVLGTSFNVKAYADEDHEETVLVSGKVSLSNKNFWSKPTVLAPGQMGKLFSNNDFIKIEKVDVNSYTSWAEGYLIFRNEIAREVLRQVSRYYNKEIEVQKNANFVTFTGKLDLTEEFEVILNRITKTSSLRYFYENDKIIIKE